MRGYYVLIGWCIIYKMNHQMPELKLKFLIRNMVGYKIEVWDMSTCFQ